MGGVIGGIEAVLGSLPLDLLEVWGRFAFLVGSLLALAAFSGLTFRPGGGWGLGRERLAWDAEAVLSIPVTFVAIIVTGFLGSFVVLVPGAQTLESLKDLVVFLCIVLFGYPALITAPFAYGLSDLIEGVPPEFLLAWLPGYFINPSCFWIAYQLFGRDPDFKRARTWALYGLFVALFMALEPVLWGYLCAGKFGPSISYKAISGALFFTTGITWILAPAAMLVAYPLAVRAGMFWARIPGHVKERRLGSEQWIWESGPEGHGSGSRLHPDSWPIRMVVLAPFIALVLLMVGATAYLTLGSARRDAERHATEHLREISAGVALRLEDLLARGAGPDEGPRTAAMLGGLAISRHGFAASLDRRLRPVATSPGEGGPMAAAIARLAAARPTPEALAEGLEFRLDHVVEKPLARTTWLVRAVLVPERGPTDGDRIVLVAMPESYFLAGVSAGSSLSAMVFAIALLSSLAVAAWLAALVTSRLRDVSVATEALARGEPHLPVPVSGIDELDTLARSFDDMAERRRHYEERLVEARAQLRTILEHMPDYVGSVDRDGTVRFVNRLPPGYAIEDVVGRPWTLYTPPELAGQLAPPLREVLERGESRSLEVPIPTPAGETRWFSFRIGPGGKQVGLPGALVIAREITDAKRTEAQLIASDRLAAMGTLAAGVAHEINNPLAAIIANLDLVLRGSSGEGPPADPGAGILEEIRDAHACAERIRVIVRDLKVFSRASDESRGPVDTHPILESTVRMVWNELRHRARLVRQYDEVPPVLGNSSRLGQVFLNLLMNAAQSIPEGNAAGNEIRLRTLLGEAGEVVVEVSDTGCGIPPEVLKRLFTPFFTTKPVGTGTGLGLAICQRIVGDLGGRIEVESEVGRGSLFRLRLKAASTREAASVAAATKVPEARRRARILVVDDEPLLRTVIRKGLHAEHDVVLAEGGKQALGRLAGGERFDLILCDLMMPEMTGFELHEALVRTDPVQAGRMVFMTGGAFTAKAVGFLDGIPNPRLEKPFGHRELRTIVNELVR